MAENAKIAPDSVWHERINWLNLKGFGKTSAASLTMATPFVGYLILYHEAARDLMGGLGDYLTQSTGEVCTPWLTFDTRLNLLYFGLLLLGIGTILYRAFAHGEIKANDSVSMYLDRNADHMTARNLRSMFVTIQSRHKSMASRLVTRGEWLDRKQVPSLSQAVRESQEAHADPDLRADVMRSYFNVLDRYSHRGWAWATAALYLAGFALLGIPGLLFTARVLCSMVY